MIFESLDGDFLRLYSDLMPQDFSDLVPQDLRERCKGRERAEQRGEARAAAAPRGGWEWLLGLADGCWEWLLGEGRGGAWLCSREVRICPSGGSWRTAVDGSGC
jgi:hypothetical protein